MNIRELREKLELSQQDLSDKTGIPKARIAKWEQGKGNPKQHDFDILKNFFYNQVENSETIAEEERAPYHKKLSSLKNGASGKKSIPFFDAPAAGSDITVTEMTAIHATLQSFHHY